MSLDRVPLDVHTVVDESGCAPNVIERAKKRIETDMEGILNEYFPESTYVSEVVDPESGEKFKVIDIEHIKENLKIEQRLSNVRVSVEKLAFAFIERHKHERVITPQQVTRGEYNPKLLFYYPESPDAAPLSYRNVDEVEYRSALLAFYEQLSIVPIQKIFAEQYEFAATKYS